MRNHMIIAAAEGTMMLGCVGSHAVSAQAQAPSPGSDVIAVQDRSCWFHAAPWYSQLRIDGAWP